MYLIGLNIDIDIGTSIEIKFQCFQMLLLSAVNQDLTLTIRGYQNP